MHYIRFLKAPKVELQKTWITVRALITVTTDLGDDFLALELPIYAHLIRDGDGFGKQTNTAITTTLSTWKSGLRALWLVFPHLPVNALEHPVRMLISTRFPDTGLWETQNSMLDHLPAVFDAWSEPFGLTDKGAMKWVERRLAVSEAATLRICEEMGESIARHIWDAGVALAALLCDVSIQSRLQDEYQLLAARVRSLSGLRAIELGSGCGIVGLQLAQICPKAQVLLTDLPEAMEVLERNVSIATLAQDSQVSTNTLNWDDESLPEAVAGQTFDLVLVSDCTYNSDSIPSLVRTLASLIERSPGALVVVSMKVRHPSEAIFHESMAKAGLQECHCWTFELPDERDGYALSDCNTVYVYVYQNGR